MQTSIIIALLTVAGFFACHRDPETETPIQPTPRIALMIGFDVSKTYTLRTRPNEHFFREAATQVASTGGEISFLLIASPDSAGELIQAYFRTMPPEPASNATYTSQIAYKDSCAQIRKHNDQEINRFVEACLARLNEEHDHQHTDVNALLSEADTYFRGAGVADCIHLLYLATDGLQDVRLKHRTDTILQPELLALPDVRVFCTGWKNETLPKGWKKLVSHESMIREIHSHTQ